MRWSWKIGRLAGINLYVHATFLLLVFFILFGYWATGHSTRVALSGLFFILAIFACIVAHEYGHALTARRFGIATRDIILLPIGGVSRLERMPEKPTQELAVAVAGPAVNVVIAALILAALVAGGHTPTWKQLTNLSWSGGDFLTRVMATNLWLVAFNLLPAFPMDGGRVLRALLATRMEYTQATQAAAHVGQAMALIFGFLGLFFDPFLIFIALFVWMGASEEAAMVTMRYSLGGVPVQRVMHTEFRSLQPDDPLSLAVNDVQAGWQHDFPVLFGDRVLGVLTREDLVRVLAERGPGAHVREAMQRDVPVVDSHDMLERAIATLRAAGVRSIPVVHNGQLVGMLTMENVGEFIMIQSALKRAQEAQRRTSPVVR